MPKPRRKSVRFKPKMARSSGRGTARVRAEGGVEPGDQRPSARPGNGKSGSARAAGARPGGGRGERGRAIRRTRPGSSTHVLGMEETLKARELFWANVVREILCSLAEASRQARAAAEEGQGSGEAPGPAALAKASGQAVEGPGPARPDVLDGRICVITTFGERIPIAEVKPLFAMGVDQSPQTRALSVAVECSVFQILTPKGMVYTIPIHEIRGVRAVSEELMSEVERERGDDGPERPFGFAAFTSMARAGIPGGDLVTEPAEDESNWE